MEIQRLEGVLTFVLSVLLSQFVPLDGALDSLQDIGDLVGTLGNLFGAADQCEFECENGATPVQRANHEASSDGCGSYGMTFDVMSFPGFTKCCHSHDICYDTCGKDKTLCDREFKICLQKYCKQGKKSGDFTKEQNKGCETGSSMLHGGAAALGCQAFQQSQKSACQCSPTAQKLRRNKPREDNNEL